MFTRSERENVDYRQNVIERGFADDKHWARFALFGTDDRIQIRLPYAPPFNAHCASPSASTCLKSSATSSKSARNSGSFIASRITSSFAAIGSTKRTAIFVPSAKSSGQSGRNTPPS